MRFIFASFAIFVLLGTSPAFGVGVASHWVNVTRPSHRWELRPHERTRPVIVGDILYFGNLDGDVYAVHRIDGYMLWHHRMPGAVEGALAYGRSKIFVGDSQGNLYALNARDGSVAWKFKVPAEWLAAPLILRDKVYAFTSHDELYALGAEGNADGTAKEIWHYSHRGDEKMTIRGGAGPAGHGSTIYQGFSDGNLVALSAGKGEVLWSKKLRSRERFYDVDTVPFVNETSVIAGTFDGKIYHLDRDSGDTKWVFPVGSYGGFHVEEGTDGNAGKVYFAGLDGHFYALDMATSGVLWKRPFKEGIGLTPTRVGDYLVFTTSSDPVYVLDPETGNQIAVERLGTGSLAAATPATDGWFYCLSNYGNLYAFEIRKELGKTKKGPETIAAPSAMTRIGESSSHNG